MKKLPLLLFLCMLLPSCRQIVDDVLPKSMAAEVSSGAAEPESWYGYLPEREPGFCLYTRNRVIWRDPRLQLGYWRGLHPYAPHRVLMEAYGDILIVNRNYVWDGCTVGDTKMRDLLPTLRHDALYHALKEGAKFSRRAVDRAFLRDQRAAGNPCAGLHYCCIRLFGHYYNADKQEVTMFVVPTQKRPAPAEAQGGDEKSAWVRIIR